MKRQQQQVNQTPLGMEGLEPMEEEFQQNYLLPPPEEEREVPEIGIIRELSPKKVLEQLRMNLKGYFWDYKEKEYTRIPGFEPLMNDKGIAKYLSFMSAIVTDLVTFSKYDKEEINDLVLYICDKAIPTIHINYKEYGIKEKSDLEIIDVQIFNLTLAAFKKAVGGGDRNLVRGTLSEQIMNRQSNMPMQMPQQKQGIFSRMNPFSKGGGF